MNHPHSNTRRLTRPARLAVLAVLVVAAGAALATTLTAAGELRIEQAADRSVRVTAPTYSAAFDAGGNWKSLVIQGTEMLGDGARFPSKTPPDSINVRGRLLAIRNEQVTFEYEFDETGFALETRGEALRLGLSPSVTAYIQAKGGGAKGAATTRSLGDIVKVISGNAAFAMDQPFHIRDRQLFPSVLTRGTKPDAPFKVRFECGMSADPAELLELAEILPIDKVTKTVPAFAPGETPVFEVAIRNLGTGPLAAELTWQQSDAFMDGKLGELHPLTTPEIPPGELVRVRITTPVTAPGIHWLNFELCKGGKAFDRERRAFVFDAGNFLGESTRPADFADFWKQRLAALRAVPLAASVAEVPERSTEVAAHYRVEIADLKGARVAFDLQAPRKPGPHLAVFGGKLGEKATNPSQILLAFPHPQWPEQATYNRWVSASDNNHIDCYLLAVRITDYLRSRADVASIFLKGASRQGPIQLVNAALDATKIVAVDAHVPTSMGLSWSELPYRGWGRTPKPAAMAAYVDPVNFAQDLSVPFIVDEGVFDGLSPAPGALALFNRASRAPWKRISIEPGGHGYFTSGFRKEATAELEKVLGVELEASMDERILKEH